MFATYLSFEQLRKISEAVLRVTGYARDIRSVFLSDMLFTFRASLFDGSSPRAQLDMDINTLNATERLRDGTIPFMAWLNRAEQYLQTDPAAHAVIQNAQQVISKLSGLAVLTAAAQQPSPDAMEQIVKEKIILQNDLLSYSFLEAGLRSGASVFKLRVPRYDNGLISTMPSGEQVFYSGTGWLLTRQLFITNHHVVNARVDGEPNATAIDLELQCRHSVAEFDFNSDNVQPLQRAVAKLEVADHELDFAILRLDSPIERLPPGRFPQEIILNSLVNGTSPAVNIIQHPFGYAKKIAIRNNHIYKTSYPKVFYFTDTDKGSSGSPVFNDQWQAIALHRASMPVSDVAYQGKTTGWVNEGIQLKAIFDWLKQHCNVISIEIMNN